MFVNKKKPTPAAPAAPAKAKPQSKPHEDEWYLAKFTSPDAISAYLANDFLMKDKGQTSGGVRLDRAIKFGSVAHDDPDFERKWATLLAKAKRRVIVLNKGTNFQLDEVDLAVETGKSLCGSCNIEFEGEDYLCPDCRE